MAACKCQLCAVRVALRPDALLHSLDVSPQYPPALLSVWGCLVPFPPSFHLVVDCGALCNTLRCAVLHCDVLCLHCAALLCSALQVMRV